MTVPTVSKSIAPASAALALMLGSCGQQPPTSVNASVAASAPNAVATAQTPPQKAATAAPACAPAPQLALAEGFADPHHAFASDSAPFRRLEANFAAAYRASCTPALLQRQPLIQAGAAQHDRLRLKNAPDANVAAFYLDGEEGAPQSTRHMVLEFPFLTADGATHVPTTSELREAIFCAVHGATQGEDEESGRCLAD